MARLQLTKNFYLEEFQRSQLASRHGIDMSIRIGSLFYENIFRLCREVLQPVRDHFGPLTVTSGYRPPRLNKLIGGSPNSQHVTAQAADFVVSGCSPLEVCLWIRANCPGYDQVIHEFGEWVHVSVPDIDKSPRLQCLTAVKTLSSFGKARTVYFNGLMQIDSVMERNVDG